MMDEAKRSSTINKNYHAEMERLVSAYKAGDQAPADIRGAMLDAAMSTADARLAVIVDISKLVADMEAAWIDREAIWTDTLKACVGQ